MVLWSISGPHIQNTEQTSAFKIKANGSAYLLNDPTGDSLQPISGVVFATSEQKKQWELFVAEAKGSGPPSRLQMSKATLV